MKKKAAVCFMLIWIFLQFAGCTDGRQEETEAETEKQTLPLIAVGGGYEQAFSDVIEAAAERFNADNPYQVEIKTEWYQNEQYKERLAMLMTQNDVQGIFFTWEAGFLEKYVKSGKVACIGEALDSEWKERFPAGAFASVTYENKIYAVPMGQALIPVYYNKELFQENHVAVPEKWEDFLSAIEVFYRADVIPIAMGFREPWIPGQMMLELSGGIGGIRLFEDTISGSVSWEDERWEETGKTFQELVRREAFQEDFLKTAYDDARVLFTEGKAAMYPMGTWDTAAVIRGFGGTERLGVFLMPPRYEEFDDTRIKTFEKFFAVSEKCEHKEAAFAFLRTLTDELTQKSYMQSCGALPVVADSAADSAADPLTRELLELQKQVKHALTPMDRQLGETAGGEFNRISMEIAGGADAAEQFAAMQAYLKSETKKDEMEK